MFDPNYKGHADKFPNIIYKRKLAALPLFNQNPAPIVPGISITPQTQKSKPLLGSQSAPRFVPTKLHSVSSPKFMSEFKTVNNYARLCDQPFLEFSNAHFEQIFGNGSGRKRVVLDPIQKKKEKKKIQKMYTMQNNSNLMSSSSIRIEDGSPVHPSRFLPQNTLDPQGHLENHSLGRSPSSHLKVQNSIREETEELESPTKETESSQRAVTEPDHATLSRFHSNQDSNQESNHSSQPGTQPNTARSRFNTQTNQSPEVPASKMTIGSERPDSPTKIKKKYKIGDYEAIVTFVSLEITLEQEDGPKLHTRLAKNMLRRIFKKPEKDIVQLVLDGLQLEGETKLRCILKRQDRPSISEEVQSATSAFYLDEPYPVKKSELKVELEGKQFEATITFPILEINIEQLHFHEKMTLKPRYLGNLFDEKFDNLQEYFHNFSIPAQVYKSKEEAHEDQLRELPTAIKKVIKTTDFGGLMLFKSMEINLKNTSSVLPETTTASNEGTVAEKIAKRRKKDVNNASIKINVADLRSLIKCNVEELIEIIKESVSVEEGQGFAVNFDAEKMNVFKHKHEPLLETFPEVSEKFMIRFNKYLYEAQIKFPTLELYVPETNFKDIIQLTYNQLQNLIGECFQNMEDYIDQFKKPKVKVAEELPTIALLIPPTEDGSANEAAKLVKTVAENMGYKVNQGLMCRSAEVESHQELENAEEEKTKFTDNLLVHQLAHVKYAVFAWATTANTTTNQSNTLKSFLKGLSPIVKDALKDKKLFFIAETSEEAAGLEEDLSKQWRAGLNKVGVTLLKNLVIVKGDEASQKIEERLKTLDQVCEAEKEENEDN